MLRYDFMTIYRNEQILWAKLVRTLSGTTIVVLTTKTIRLASFFRPVRWLWIWWLILHSIKPSWRDCFTSMSMRNTKKKQERTIHDTKNILSVLRVCCVFLHSFLPLFRKLSEAHSFECCCCTHQYTNALNLTLIHHMDKQIPTDERKRVKKKKQKTIKYKPVCRNIY